MIYLVPVKPIFDLTDQKETASLGGFDYNSEACAGVEVVNAIYPKYVYRVAD